MSPESRVFKPEYALELLRIAESDLESAQILFQANKGRLENILFHAEQAIEKSLKAVLCARGKPVPLSHQLYVVLMEMPQDDLPPGGHLLNDLSPYATIRRYEEGKDVLERTAVQGAMKMAEQVLVWAKQKVSKK